MSDRNETIKRIAGELLLICRNEDTSDSMNALASALTTMIVMHMDEDKAHDIINQLKERMLSDYDRLAAEYEAFFQKFSDQDAEIPEGV